MLYHYMKMALVWRYSFVCISRRWQAPGAVKKSRIARNPKELASAYICFSGEVGARIKLCSNQPNVLALGDSISATIQDIDLI